MVYSRMVIIPAAAIDRSGSLLKTAIRHLRRSVTSGRIRTRLDQFQKLIAAAAVDEVATASAAAVPGSCYGVRYLIGATDRWQS